MPAGKTHRSDTAQPRYQKPMSRLEWPVILAHGIFMDDADPRCWGSIPQWIREGGNEVFLSGGGICVPVEQAAAALAVSIDETRIRTGASKVIIIAFSRGGIDARYCASVLGKADAIASLVTICTPHGGSFVAENGFATLPNHAARFVCCAATWKARRMGDPDADAYRVFWDLRSSSESIMKLRAAEQEIGCIACCQSYALASNHPIRRSFLRAAECPNDGLVSVRSARWGRFQGTFIGDARHADMAGIGKSQLRLAFQDANGVMVATGLSLHDVWRHILGNIA